MGRSKTLLVRKVGARPNTMKIGDDWEELIANYLRSLGFYVQVADRIRMQVRTKTGTMWITKRVDYFRVQLGNEPKPKGTIDIIAFHPKKPYTLFIQACADRGMLRKKQRHVLRVSWGDTPNRLVQVWVPSTIKGMIEVSQPIGSRWMDDTFAPIEGRWAPQSILH